MSNALRVLYRDPDRLPYLALMRRCAGNLSLASREADLARHHLRDLLRKHGLYGASWSDPEE